MVANAYNPVQKIATLAHIRVFDGPSVQGNVVREIRIQNWCNEDYIYKGNAYEFLDFEGGTSTARQLDFANSGTTFTIGNRSTVRDSLIPLREWLNAENGWRQARFTITQIWPLDPLVAIVDQDSLQILSSSVQTTITLEQRGAAEAINCVIPSTPLSLDIAPELPFSNASQLF
jgi:hypothetical protein